MLAKNYFRPIVHSYWKFRNGVDIYLGNRSKHMVICGYPRSGTSLLYNMISASIGGFHCEKFEKRAIERLHRPGNYVTKFPLDILNVEEILNANVLFKDIYFLVCIRDVRDLITSRHPLVPDEYFIGYKNSLWPANPQFTEWRHNAPGIEAIYKAINACSSVQGINMLKVRYENLICDTRRTQEEIEKFLGLKFSGSFSDYHKRGHKHAYKYSGRYLAKDASLVRESSQIDIGRIAKWRSPDHKRIIDQQFSQYPELFEILVGDGYEKNNEWFSSELMK